MEEKTWPHLDSFLGMAWTKWTEGLSLITCQTWITGWRKEKKRSADLNINPALKPGLLRFRHPIGLPTMKMLTSKWLKNTSPRTLMMMRWSTSWIWRRKEEWRTPNRQEKWSDLRIRLINHNNSFNLNHVGVQNKSPAPLTSLPSPSSASSRLCKWGKTGSHRLQCCGYHACVFSQLKENKVSLLFLSQSHLGRSFYFKARHTLITLCHLEICFCRRIVYDKIKII